MSKSPFVLGNYVAGRQQFTDVKIFSITKWNVKKRNEQFYVWMHYGTIWLKYCWKWV